MARDLSLIVPCYNEGPHLRASVAVVTRLLDAHGYDYELIFVDDASIDDTRRVIAELCAKQPRHRHIFTPKIAAAAPP